jgi:hypothetical protein
MTDPQKDEHIEELLSKLQGIFGKLSHSEEEEAKQKIEIPTPAPKESEKMAPSPPPAEAPPSAKPTSPSPINLYTEPAAASPPPPAAAAPPPTNPGVVSSPGTYESQVPLGDPEKLIIPTAVYYPFGKDAEAKSLAQKLEMMTPKFTKVAFRLRVIVFMAYDPKTEWKEALMTKAAEAQFQTVFAVVDRSMEDSKKKAIAGELEAKNIYFQDVPLASIEKKAYYTDILLGLVFFFDSHRPPAPPEGTAP